MDNPFIFRTYQTKELFCDRQEELKMLVTNTLSGADTTLIAQRRIGKTGLVYRLIDEIRSESLPVLPIYVDIFATRLLEDFVKTLSSAIMNAIPEKSSIGKKFAKFIRSLRPLITYDPLTSAPQIQLTLQSEEEKKQTLTGLLTFLDRQEKKVLMAIDEFQQIREYPEKDVEAMLRTIIQTLNNVTFLYCGSKRHIMLDIFGSERNPFHRSTAFVTLQKLDREVYAEFITKHFHEGGFGIDDTAVGYILDWTRGHTYFTQRLCHTVYDMARGRVDVALVKQAAVQILQSDAVVFGQYQQLLTAGQWNFLIAVAKEGEASQITSRQFLRRHHLGNPSSVSRIVPSLVEKNLLDENVTEGKTIYGLNDVFLSRWLEKKY